MKTRNWNQHSACFQFSSQIKFWKQFLFSIYFKLPNKYFNLKNKKVFLKTKNKKKKQIPAIKWSTYRYTIFFWLGLHSVSCTLLSCVRVPYNREEKKLTKKKPHNTQGPWWAYNIYHQHKYPNRGLRKKE